MTFRLLDQFSTTQKILIKAYKLQLVLSGQSLEYHTFLHALCIPESLTTLKLFQETLWNYWSGSFNKVNKVPDTWCSSWYSFEKLLHYLRPYHTEYTGSHLNTVVTCKQLWAGLVLGWETARELLVLQVSFFPFLWAGLKWAFFFLLWILVYYEGFEIIISTCICKFCFRKALKNWALELHVHVANYLCGREAS